MMIYTAFAFKEAERDVGGQELRQQADAYFSQSGFNLTASQWASNSLYDRHCVLLAFDRQSSPFTDVYAVLANIRCSYVSWIGHATFDDKYRFDQFVLGYVGYSICKTRIPLLPDLPGYPSTPPQYSGYWKKAS
jgi:hypothetical protein